MIDVFPLDFRELLITFFKTLSYWEDHSWELATEDVEFVLDVGTCKVDRSLEFFEGGIGYSDFGEGEREYLGLKNKLLPRFLRIVLAFVPKKRVVSAGEGLVEGKDILALHLLNIEIEPDLLHLRIHFFQPAFHDCSLLLLRLYSFLLEHIGP